MKRFGAKVGNLSNFSAFDSFDDWLYEWNKVRPACKCCHGKRSVDVLRAKWAGHVQDSREAACVAAWKLVSLKIG